MTRSPVIAARLGLAVSCALLLAKPVQLKATTYVWDGGLSHSNFTLNDSWSTANNWQGLVPVSADDTSVSFTQSGQWKTATQNIATPLTLNSLVFDSTSNVTAVSGNQLNFTTLIATSLPPVINQASSTNVVISAPILASANLTVDTAGTGTLELSGDISGSGKRITKIDPGTLILSGNNSYTGGTNVGGGVLVLNSSGALGTTGAIAFTGFNGTLRYSSNNQTDYSPRFLTTGGQDIRVDTNNTSVIFASAIVGINTRVTKLGPGTLTLGGSTANTGDGMYSVLGGTLLLSKPVNIAAIGGDLTIGNSSNPGAPASVIARQTQVNQTTSSTDLTVFSDGLFDLNFSNGTVASVQMTGGELRLGNAILNINGDVTATSAGTRSALISSTDFNNDLNLNLTTRTFNVTPGGGGATYDLDVQAGISRGNLVKAGAGVMRLAGVHNTGLAVTLQSGVIAAASNTAFGETVFTSDPLPTLTLAGGTLVADGADRTFPNPLTIAGNVTFGASLDGSPRAITFTGTASLTASATLTASNPAGTTLTDFAIGSNSLTVDGASSLTVNGKINGAGGIVKDGSGTLSLNGDNTGFGGGLLIKAGTVTAKGGASLGTGTVTLANGAGLAFTDQVVTLTQNFQLGTGTLAPAAGGQLTYLGASVTGGALGAGQHSFAASTQLNNVRVATGAALSQSGGTIGFNNVLLTGTSSFTQASGSVLNTTGDFTANPATSITLNGTMNTQGASISSGLAIHGGAVLANSVGTLFLDGSQGASISAGGTLSTAAGSAIELGNSLLNNGTQTGTLHVNFGGAIIGGGSFGNATVATGARVSPGDGLGTASFASLTLDRGANLQFELNSTHGLPDSGADFLSIGGLLDLSDGSGSTGAFKLSLVSLLGNGTPGALGDFDPTLPFSLTLATAAGGIQGFTAGEFAIDVSGFANDLAGGAFSVSAQGNDLLLNFTPVPEPASTLIFGAGLGLLAATRRHRRRAALN